MSRFLFIVRKLNMGGIEKATVALANELIANGHEVHIWIQKGVPGIEVPNGVIIHSINIEAEIRKTISGFFNNILNRTFFNIVRPGTRYWGTAQKFADLFSEKLNLLEQKFGKFDCIVARGEGAFSNLINVKDERLFFMVEGGPHTNEKYKLAPKIYQRLYEGKKVICVSQGIGDVLMESLERYNVKLKEPIHVIYNLLNPELIRDKADAAIDEKFDFPYIVHVGRLHSVKSQDFLLRSFAEFKNIISHKLKESGAITEKESNVLNLTELNKLKLVFVGDGPLKEELKSLAENLKISNDVVFVGNKSNPYPYIKGAQALTLTSKMEGMGLVLVEALILHVQPIAVLGKGGIKDIMHGELLKNTTRFDEKDYANKIIEVLNNPTQITAQMYEPFTPKAVVKKFEELANYQGK